MSKIILSELSTLSERGTLRVSPGSKLDISKTQSYLQLPAGSTEFREEIPDAGELRYNTTTKRLEFYSGSAWVEFEFADEVEEIIQHGLLFQYEPNHPKGHCASGERFFDVTPNNRHATNVQGSPTWQGSGVRYFSYDGSDDAHRVDLNMGYQLTVQTVGRSQNAQWNSYSGLGSNREENGFIMHNNINNTSVTYYVIGNATQSYTGIGTVDPNTAGSNITSWNFYALTSNGSDYHQYYLNGLVYGNVRSTLSTARTASGIGSSTISLGEDSDQISSRKNAIDIGHHSVYDIQLSPLQIWKNYLKLASIFGMPTSYQRPTSGLMFRLDASDYDSYPRQGNTWSDLSGNNRNATMNFGPNLVFDPRGYITQTAYVGGSIPSESAFQFQNGESVHLECWVKCDNINSQTYQAIFTIGGVTAVTRDRMFQCRISQYGGVSGYVDVLYRNSTNTTWHILRTEYPEIIDGRWYNIAAGLTYGNGNMQIAINGLAVPTVYHSGDGTQAPLVPTDATAWIGIGEDGDAGSSGERLEGSIGEISLYDRVLSVQDIREYYAAGATRYANLD